jgi:hypothetical protein
MKDENDNDEVFDPEIEQRLENTKQFIKNSGLGVVNLPSGIVIVKKFNYNEEKGKIDVEFEVMQGQHELLKKELEEQFITFIKRELNIQ